MNQSELELRRSLAKIVDMMRYSENTILEELAITTDQRQWAEAARVHDVVVFYKKKLEELL